MHIVNRFRTFRRDLAELPPFRRRLLVASLVASGLLFLAGFSLTVYLWQVVRLFPEAPFAQPSRLYGRATQLVPGAPVTLDAVAEELRQAGYREAGEEDHAPLGRGTFRRQGDRLDVQLRPCPTPEGTGGGVPLTVEFRDGRVSRLRVAGRPAQVARLDPPLLASFYGPEVNERRPVALDQLPGHVVQAILAAEDGRFFLHPGISPTGMVRALWANLRGGEVQQGGSTITQQLVKNLYLTRERTVERKVKEVLIAVVLEVRYSKREILEAYLNEVYWGRSGPANVIGLGAASRAWFGKDAAELSLAEAATLAAMIRAPSDSSPVADAAKVVERRNRVIQRMAELDWITPEQARRAAGEPLLPQPRPVEVRPLAPYFAGFAAAEARERFGIENLEDEGYLLFSTLGRREQEEAEQAVAQGLAGLEKGWERRRRSQEPLQAALVSVDPRDGSILSWVGGRDFAVSQFDRAAQARRQAGSVFKPVVYAAAFRAGRANPATLLRDSPILVRVGTDEWRPQNNDRGFRGLVTVRTALEQSLNVPTVRLALQAGLPQVIQAAHDLGIGEDLQPNPALALGALEVTPLEMTQVYSTLANGGVRTGLYGLSAVRDRFGETVLGDDLEAPRRVLPAQAAWLVTSILQGVLDRGTGAGVRQLGIPDRLAGKTGTTNDRRDSWFAGYSPDRVTVVWVGYDDNSETHLSGSRAALPIWSRFVAAVRPAGGFVPFTPPPGIVQVMIDPLTGQLATPYCPYRVTEQFTAWEVPREPCHLHTSASTQTWADAGSSGQGGLNGESGVLSLDAGIDPGDLAEPGRTLAPRPEDADGSILIRPAQQERAPAPPPP